MWSLPTINTINADHVPRETVGFPHVKVYCRIFWVNWLLKECVLFWLVLFELWKTHLFMGNWCTTLLKQKAGIWKKTPAKMVLWQAKKRVSKARSVVNWLLWMRLIFSTMVVWSVIVCYCAQIAREIPVFSWRCPSTIPSMKLKSGAVELQINQFSTPQNGIPSGYYHW